MAKRLVLCAALLAAGCSVANSPTAPSGPIASAALSAPAPMGPSQASQVDPPVTMTAKAANGTPFVPVRVVVTVSSASPVHTVADCGNGTGVQDLGAVDGDGLAWCTYSSAGVYVVTFTGTPSGATAATVSIAPGTDPAPAVLPAPASSTPAGPQLQLIVACVPAAAGTATPCNLTGFVGAAIVTSSLDSIRWDYGDGSTGANGVTTAHVFAQRGSFTVGVSATYNGQSGKGSTRITVP